MKHALHIAGIYNVVFEPRPNGLALGSMGSVMTWIALSIIGSSCLEKASCQERTRLSCPEACAEVTSKV